MPEVDFPNTEEASSFSLVPKANYLCELVKIEEQLTKHKDVLWRLHFKIIEGEYSGSYIFDNMVFSQAAMKRVKLICSRLGLDVSTKINLIPEMILHKRCILSVTIEKYTDSQGNIKEKNVVPYAGYELAEKSSDRQPGDEKSDQEAEAPPF